MNLGFFFEFLMLDFILIHEVISNRQGNIKISHHFYFSNRQGNIKISHHFYLFSSLFLFKTFTYNL
jgi:hypothetical protein